MNIIWQWGQDIDTPHSYYGLWVNDKFYGWIHLNTHGRHKPWRLL